MRPVAEMASPSPTVLTGFLHTSTGLRTNRISSFLQEMTGLSGSSSLSVSPENNWNLAGTFRSRRSAFSSAVSHAWRPAIWAPAATALSLFDQAFSTTAIIWYVKEWKWIRDRRDSDFCSADLPYLFINHNRISEILWMSGWPWFSWSNRSAWGPPHDLDAKTSSCSFRPNELMVGRTWD